MCIHVFYVVFISFYMFLCVFIFLYFISFHVFLMSFMMFYMCSLISCIFLSFLTIPVISWMSRGPGVFQGFPGISRDFKGNGCTVFLFALCICFCTMNTRCYHFLRFWGTSIQPPMHLYLQFITHCYMFCNFPVMQR